MNPKVKCPECPQRLPLADVKWHRELVHNADSEARWLAAQTGERK